MFIAGQLTAQTRYEAGMQKGLEQFGAAKTAEDMAAASAFFERIADAEKDKWLPYYYAAYANHLTGWMNPKADKDKVAEKSKDLLSKAEALERNADTYCMRQMIAIQQMNVDPMARWQTYGTEASNALAEAKKIDANNPRIYLLDGQTLIYHRRHLVVVKQWLKNYLRNLFNYLKPISLNLPCIRIGERIRQLNC